MNFDIYKVINGLKQSQYPFFVSEANFQIRFMLKAKELFPNLIFYPEYPHKLNNDEKAYFDLAIFDQLTKEYSLIELKYPVGKKKKIQIPGNLEFELGKRSSTNGVMLESFKDISRLERAHLNNSFKKSKCYFVFLTNLGKYWEYKDDSNSKGKDFRIKDNVPLLHGPKTYVDSNSNIKVINIKNDYSGDKTPKYNIYIEDFRYMILEI